MKKKRWSRLLALLVLGLSVSLLAGCGAESTEAAASKEDAETIQVYLWTTNLYDTYAPYIQSQLPDVNIEFVVGHNDLDFYKFLQENGGLPDIITCCRFSLHDAAPLKGSLMNLAMTNEAGAVYNNYLTNFMNEDGSINWLPVCADAHGFVVNRGLFEKYDIPLYCGEYGVIDLADNVSKINWASDICAVFDKYGIGRAYWNYKEKDYGIVNIPEESVRKQLAEKL